jgi:hypothetical protein
LSCLPPTFVSNNPPKKQANIYIYIFMASQRTHLFLNFFLLPLYLGASFGVLLPLSLPFIDQARRRPTWFGG